jgi:hypothetical protein
MVKDAQTMPMLGSLMKEQGTATFGLIAPLLPRCQKNQFYCENLAAYGLKPMKPTGGAHDIRSVLADQIK